VISVPQEHTVGIGEQAVLALAVGLLAAGIGAFYYFADQPQVVRVLMVLAGIAAAAGTASRTSTGKRALAFLGDARTEVRRVVWPTRKEAVQITAAVAVAVLIGAIVLWMFDWVVARAVRFLIGIEG
jgi:preprotein translocase subunit SecE